MLRARVLEEGCPARPCRTLVFFPLLVLPVPLQHFRVSLAVGNPWEEERSSGDRDVQPAPGSLLGWSAGG